MRPPRSYLGSVWASASSAGSCGSSSGAPPSTWRCARHWGNDVSLAGEVALVTGFPGFHARKLCRHLLAAEPELRLVLLLAASDRERAAHHLELLSRSERE